MKKTIKLVANKLLKSKGVTIARIHEITFLNEKYKVLIEETESFFREIIFKDLPKNPKRIKLLAQLNGTQISEVFYILNYLHLSMKLKGDICEFGIANGATSTVLANEIKNTEKKLWLFDSFQGLSKPSKEDKLIKDIFNLGSMGKYEGTMSYKQEEVIQRLNKINFPKNRTEIVPGYIEHSIVQNHLPKKVCFAYVDFDLYNPIRTALEFLDKVLVKGGYIVVDDFGTFSKGAKTAVDEFLTTQKGKYVFNLPYAFAGHFCILQKIV